MFGVALSPQTAASLGRMFRHTKEFPIRIIRIWTDAIFEMEAVPDLGNVSVLVYFAQR